MEIPDGEKQPVSSPAFLDNNVGMACSKAQICHFMACEREPICTEITKNVIPAQAEIQTIINR